MMTMEQFEEEKARLTILYGGSTRESSGKRAQAFARLYAKSGWTQTALAEREKMSLSRMNEWLLFGRFLISDVIGNDVDCSEQRFRMHWRRTVKTDTHAMRFAAIKTMLEDEDTQPPAASVNTRDLAKKLIAQFRDGKFHRLRDIADALDVDMSAIRGLCDRIVSQGTFQTFGERRPAPPKDGSYAYRFVKGGKKKIDLTAFYAEAKPVLDEMENVINGHSVHFSQQLMKVTFAQFRQVIDRVAR